MAGLAGKSGSLTYTGSNTDFRIRSWTCNMSVDLLDDTSSGDDGHKTYVQGTSDIRGSFVANYDSSDAVETFLPSAAAIATVKLESGEASKLITLTEILVETMDVAMDINGMVEITCNFVGNGQDIATASAL